jgi:hypothetical protein
MAIHLHELLGIVDQIIKLNHRVRPFLLLSS